MKRYHGSCLEWFYDFSTKMYFFLFSWSTYYLLEVMVVPCGFIVQPCFLTVEKVSYPLSAITVGLTYVRVFITASLLLFLISISLPFFLLLTYKIYTSASFLELIFTLNVFSITNYSGIKFSLLLKQ